MQMAEFGLRTRGTKSFIIDEEICSSVNCIVGITIYVQQTAQTPSHVSSFALAPAQANSNFSYLLSDLWKQVGNFKFSTFCNRVIGVQKVRHLS